MTLKRSGSDVQVMLKETILALCRNALSFHGKVCIEGLLGITLDEEEIFLVHINENIANATQQGREKRKSNDEDQDVETRRHRRKRRKSRDDVNGSGQSSDDEASLGRWCSARLVVVVVLYLYWVCIF